MFTTEDRRKAAATTDQIRRERAEVVALELENRLCDERVARIEARRARKREQARRRREAQRLAPQTEVWMERGYGARF